MYIISVIPISRGIPFSELSYYSSEALSAGVLVEIPLGKKNISGIVFSSNSLIESKSQIKQSRFSLKKIKKIIGPSPLGEALINGLQDASVKTLTPVGALLSTMVNELFLETFQSVLMNLTLEKKDPAPMSVCYGSFADRADYYKRIIRSAFAEKKSVVFVAPTIRSTENWFNVLSKGISAHSVILHSKKNKRDQKSSLTKIKSSERPLFICTTPQSAFVPRTDIKTLVLEDEASSLYKTHDRYSADMRVVLRSISDSYGISVVYGDVLPRFETLVEAGMTHLSRSFNPERLVVVNTESFRSLLPTEIVELVRYCQKNKKSLFLYTNRKGIAPISRCADCGTSVDCPSCGLPIVLRYKVNSSMEKERMFVCSHCASTLPADHHCEYCGSWNITPVAIGTESIKEAVETLVDKEHIITIDDDMSLDDKQSESLIAEIQKKKFFVMIGTSKMLPFVKNIDFVAVPFFDRLLSTPSPFIVEEVLRLVMTLNEKTKDTLILCTKKPDFPITKLLSTKKIEEIIDSDIENRKALLYPPFGLLLKLSVTVPVSHVEVISQKIKLFFKDLDNTMLPPRRISPESMKVLCVWIVQATNSYLADNSEILESFLIDLRYPYKIEINPARLA
jgi:primosomal protein N'